MVLAFGTTVFAAVGFSNGAVAQTLTTLYGFGNLPDGGFPSAPVIFDTSGNLYGTTKSNAPGGTGVCGYWGCGTVFKLTPNANGTYTETVLHQSTGGTDGAIPSAGLIADSQGNLYGTTNQGGGGTAVLNAAQCSS
jgi:hypothetical protein